MYQIEVVRQQEMRKSTRIKFVLVPVSCIFGAIGVSSATDALTSKVVHLLHHLFLLVVC